MSTVKWLDYDHATSKKEPCEAPFSLVAFPVKSPARVVLTGTRHTVGRSKWVQRSPIEQFSAPSGPIWTSEPYRTILKKYPLDFRHLETTNAHTEAPAWSCSFPWSELAQTFNLFAEAKYKLPVMGVMDKAEISNSHRTDEVILDRMLFSKQQHI